MRGARRAVLLFSLAALVRFTAAAADLKLPAAFRPILDLAGASPPEFAARAMLRMVASRKIEDKDTRRALCIRAFEAAANAHERLPRRAIPGVAADSVAGSLDRAHRLHLDSLSLQSEAVLLLLRDDPRKARELFEEIPRPSVPALSCTDALRADTSRYADALVAVEEQAFTPAERKKEEQVAFLLTYLSGITSPSELAPAARMVATADGINDAERELLIARFNGIVENLNPDPRAYAASVADIRSAITRATRPSFEKLAARMKTVPACGDPNPSAPKRLFVRSGALQPEMPDAGPFWQSAGSKDILAQAKAIRFGSENRDTPDWKDRFTQFTASLESWTPDPDEPPSVYFHERAILYQGLIDVAPDAAARRSILDNFMAFLNASPLERENPPEWFSVFADMWHRIPFHEPGEQPAAEDSLARSGNPVVSLYLMLEKTIPESPGGRP